MVDSSKRQHLDLAIPTTRLFLGLFPSPLELPDYCLLESLSVNPMSPQYPSKKFHFTYVNQNCLHPINSTDALFLLC